MAGYNGLGVHKNVISASSKLEDETLPKLNADLNVNQQSLMNIGWMESDNIGSNELLLGQSTTPIEDYGTCGVSWKTINGKYFGAYAWFDSNANEYVLQFTSPNPSVTPNSWIEFTRKLRYNISLSELEALDGKAVANKEWVLSKIPVAGITKLQEDLTPELGGHLECLAKNINNFAALNFRSGISGKIDSDTGVTYDVDKLAVKGLSYHMFRAKNEDIIRIANLNVNIYKPCYFSAIAQPVSDSNIDLGANTYRWKTLYAKNGDFSGTVKAAEPIVSTDLATKNYVDNKSLPLSPYQQGAASINFGVSHYNKELRGSYTSAMNYVLPGNAPKGTWFGLTNMTTNSLTVSAVSGVTIYSRGGLLGVDGQFGRIYAYCDGTAWFISGDII